MGRVCGSCSIQERERERERKIEREGKLRDVAFSVSVS